MRPLFYFLVILPLWVSGQSAAPRNAHYVTNQAPLAAQPYTELPLGAIRPQGWLQHLLELQRDGLTGHLDSVYTVVCGPNNGWLGGTGDGWERGPYWLDGLVPLAYLLDDENLKAKAQEWIEWSIANQRPDGYFGPKPLPEHYAFIPGTQQGMRDDWWPKMVMLKVMRQYYSATGDERVVTLMTNYFRYQLEHLDEQPLGTVTFWGNRRGGDNLMVVLWLYNITGDEFLLELAEKLHAQTFDWATVQSDGTLASNSPLPNLHCVNVAQGLKEPVIYYQRKPEPRYLSAPKQGLEDLRRGHGFVNGMYGADERLHGNSPTQGSEFCSAVELMFSLESMLPISGDMYYADYLEKVAFNALPTQHDDGYHNKQYFQQVNQVNIQDGEYNFFDNDLDRLVYGVTTGFACCTTNMHQGWPKFIQNLWYATADNGLAALVYGSSSVTATVADGQEVHVTETTGYPFRDRIGFEFGLKSPTRFPFHLRIPGWATEWTLTINGEPQSPAADNNIVVIDREWKSGDRVELQLPMEVRFSWWAEAAAGVERGPLVYALKLQEEWQEHETESWPDPWYSVTTPDPWNYGFPEDVIAETRVSVEEIGEVGDMPWNLENAPIRLTMEAIQLPEWKLYDKSAGPSPAHPNRYVGNYETTPVTLVPYGCTTMRIAQFPVVDLRQ